MIDAMSLDTLRLRNQSSILIRFSPSAENPHCLAKTTNDKTSEIMKKTSHLIVSIFASLIVSAPAAVILQPDATWPTGTAEFDGGNFSSTQQRGVSGTRKLRQTFQITSGFTVGEIFLRANTYDDDLSFQINFFNVANIAAGTWTAGTQIGSTITVTAPATGAATTGFTNLRIGLSQAEQIFLAANTGSAGYGMEIVSTNTNLVFAWTHSTSSVHGGRKYIEDGSGAANEDFGMALVAIPEPAAALLASFGALILLRRRRG